eukprot:scaffold421392_cov64-Attheya_sp.AAC.1
MADFEVGWLDLETKKAIWFLNFQQETQQYLLYANFSPEMPSTTPFNHSSSIERKLIDTNQAKKTMTTINHHQNTTSHHQRLLIDFFHQLLKKQQEKRETLKYHSRERQGWQEMRVGTRMSGVPNQGKSKLLGSTSLCIVPVQKNVALRSKTINAFSPPLVKREDHQKLNAREKQLNLTRLILAME